MLLMTLSYYIMWSPVFFYGMIWQLAGKTNAVASFTVSVLALGNSMVNPLIYVPTIKPYRNVFKKMFCKHCMATNNE